MIKHGIEYFSKLDIKTILRANFQVSYNFVSNFYLGGVFTPPTNTPTPLLLPMNLTYTKKPMNNWVKENQTFG